MMRLAVLNPRFIGSGGVGVSQPSGRPCKGCAGTGCDVCHGTGKEYEPAPERHGVGLVCQCPCGDHDEGHELYVGFANPLDGGPALDSGPRWQRTGDTFDTLTLTPSILRSRAKGGCGWHGFITNGNVTGQVE
jgi:hypothetical protein